MEFGGFFLRQPGSEKWQVNETCPANAGNNGTSTSPNNGTTGRMSREGSDRIKGDRISG